MTQKERQERSRREILAAAMEEFAAADLDQVTMDAICSRHGISKGMMYHYYSSKDELFLLCAQDTFRALEEWLAAQEERLAGLDPAEGIREYFLCRERFFQENPQRKNIFENAVIRTPRQLEGEILELRRPIRERNSRFIARMAARMPLRPGMDPGRVNRYLESVETVFWPMLERYWEGREEGDVHSMLEASGQLLQMLLLGVVCPME